MATVTVVSGLPRSGTSLVLQMLHAGGVPVLEDGARGPDADNPRGYFEHAKTLRLWDDATWLHEAAGKAIKVVAPLVMALPFDHDYQLIVIERDLGEVMTSQRTMLQRRSEAATRLEGLGELVAAARDLERWLRYQPNFRCLSLAYHAVVARPDVAAGVIADFLGASLDRAAMARAVDPTLHRNRS